MYRWDLKKAALSSVAVLICPPYHSIRGAHSSVEVGDLRTNDQGGSSVHNSLAATAASHNLAIDGDAGIKHIVGLNK